MYTDNALTFSTHTCAHLLLSQELAIPYVISVLRKYFKLRYDQLGRDEINLEGFGVIQLSQRVQNDTTSCGIYCLKVYSCIFNYDIASYMYAC